MLSLCSIPLPTYNKHLAQICSCVPQTMRISLFSQPAALHDKCIKGYSCTFFCTHLLGQTEAEHIPCPCACHDGHARVAARAQGGDAVGQAMLCQQDQHVSRPPSWALAFWLVPSTVPALCETRDWSLALNANMCMCREVRLQHGKRRLRTWLIAAGTIFNLCHRSQLL